mgnify:FL=1
MTHTHSPKTTRSILGNELYECSCGARKWSNDRAITTESGTMKIEDGWYVYIPAETAEETARSHAYEMLQTEGYGYEKDASDLLDSHTPNID